MIRELRAYRLYCDWESDNAACATSVDLTAISGQEAVDYLVSHRGWRNVRNRFRLAGWLFCPDCKESSMADDVAKMQETDKEE